MRNVIISVYITLDGVMEKPENWAGQFWNEEHGKCAHALLFGADALVMGRGTYEVFASSWPNRTAADDGPGAPGFVDRINAMAKYVASTTLQEPLAWNNSHLIKGDVAAAVAKMKAQDGQNIVIYGAGPVAHTLLQHGLVDEMQVWVHPVVVGKGVQLLNNATDVPVFKLVESKTFSSGVVVHTYQPKAG